MKNKIQNLFYILLGIAVVLNIQGHKEKTLPKLKQAEQIIFNHPDSALHILESMPVPSHKKDKENNALWCLLVAQAQYRLTMKAPSDSLIKVAYAYYQTTDNARRKAMSALCLGSMNYKLGNTEAAIHLHLEAQDEMNKTDDYRLGYLIMSGLGNIHLYRNLTHDALKAYSQAYEYARKDTNKNHQITSLQYMAKCHYLLSDFDQALHTYKQCMDMASENKMEKSRFYDTLQKEIALIYTEKKQYKESLEILKSMSRSPYALWLTGRNYYSLHQLDSAYLYLQKALNTEDIYTKEAAYELLYKLSKTPKYKQFINHYGDSLLLYKDSIMSLDKSKAVAVYKQMYDHEKLKVEKQSLELEKATTTSLWMFTLVIILLLMMVFVSVSLRDKVILRKKEKELTDLSLQLYEKEQEISKNQSYLTELEQQYSKSNQQEKLLAEQNDTLEKLKSENEQLVLEKKLLYEKIASYSISSYETDNIKILSDKLHRLEKREQELSMQILTQSPVLHKLHSTPIYLNDTELKEVCSIADNVFQSFSQRLSAEVPSLSEHEIILCCLIKLRFSITEIAIFLNIASTSVSRSKHRIKGKIFSELSITQKEQNLDVWLWEY